MPKQCLNLIGDLTLLQATAQRLLDFNLSASDVIVVTQAALKDKVAAQLAEIDPALTSHLISEDAPRHTAAAIARAATYAAKIFGPKALLFVVPSDHHLTDIDALAVALEQGCAAAAEGHLVTFGIAPERPETGYGYIRRGVALKSFNAYAIEHFAEKPDAATALAYGEDGHYLWNSGMFLFTVDAVLNAYSEHAPDILNNLGNDAALRSVAFDVAVMEKTSLGAVIPCALGWSDIGSWSSVRDARPRDDNGNAFSGAVYARETSNTLIDSHTRLVAVAGLDDMIIVDTADALLIASASHGDDIRHLVHDLRQAGAPEALEATIETRPWGGFRVLSRGDGYKIKEVTIEPGHAQSLHVHGQRGETWTVITGEATVTLGHLDHVLAPAQTMTAPAKLPHRIANKGQSLLKLIEIQHGDYLGEDDIIRLKDDYNRIPPSTEPVKETA